MKEPDKILISQSQGDGVSDSTLTRLTEAEYANLSAKKGVRVYEHKGRYWRNSEQFGSLLSVPIHWMVELTPEQATFPRKSTVATKARIIDGSQNNGHFHLHIIDPKTYTFDHIHSDMRRNVRRACRAGVIIQLATPELLEQEGYAVTISALQRNRYRRAPEEKDYIRKLQDDTFFGGKGIVLAGMIPTPGGLKLGGIMTGSALGTIANADDIYIASWAKDTNVGPRLAYSFIEACQRTPGIDKIVYGRVSADRGLQAFKDRMGFPAVAVPARVTLRPGVRHAFGLLQSTERFANIRERLYGPA